MQIKGTIQHPLTLSRTTQSLRRAIAVGSAVALGLAVTAAPAHAQTAPATDPAPSAPDPAVPTPAAPAAPTPTRAEVDPIAEQVRREMAAAPKQVELHGYLRSGIGANIKGGDQDAFLAPGAGSKYRLGNEIETYGEVELDNNWINPDHSETWFKTAVKLAYVAPRNNTFDGLSAIAIREAYGEAGKVVPSHPEMTFWAGQRFYRRRDVHIIDFFFNDMSGYGAGFQELKVADSTKLAIAYITGSRELTAGEMTSIGRPLKSTLDVRLYDIPAGGGTLEFLVFPVLAIRNDLGDANRSGVGAGVFFNKPMLGGSNEISAQFGYAGAANLSASVGPAASDGWLLRIVDRATFQTSPRLSMQATAVVQLDNTNGAANGSSGNLWVSAGARPVYCFSKYTGIAFEGGVDVVRPEVDMAGTGVLAKLTVAPLIRPGMDFWARPELRAFVTAAFWNDTIKGIGIGGAAFAKDNAGVTTGVQVESWW